MIKLMQKRDSVCNRIAAIYCYDGVDQVYFLIDSKNIMSTIYVCSVTATSLGIDSLNSSNSWGLNWSITTATSVT